MDCVLKCTVLQTAREGLEMLRKVIAIITVSFALASCGGNSDPSFPGTWDGNLSLTRNTCPFTPISDLNPVFPVSVVDDTNGNFTVTSADGHIAQGTIEANILVANAPVFGDFGTTGDYTCQSSAVFQLMNVSGNAADTEDSITFINCATAAAPTVITNCEVDYTGSAVQR
jgi:hypothetical protein